MREESGSETKPFIETTYIEVAGPIIGEDALYYAGRNHDSPKAWQIVRVDAEGKSESWPMPDRLAAVQQIERLQAGLPLQDAASIASQRFRVLDPMEKSADEE